MEAGLALRTTWLGLTALLAPLPVGAGQVMLSPTAVSGTDLGTFSNEAPLGHMIDQSGVETPFVSGVTPFDTYFATPSQAFASNGPANNWQSDTRYELPLHGYVDFDLGAAHAIGKLALWNVSLKDVSVRVSATLEGLASASAAGTFRLTDHTSYPFSYPVDVLGFGTVVEGRYVRLDIASAHPIAPGLDFGYAIVGEVVASVEGAATAPTVSITRELNGDVTVNFTGTLQTADGIGDTFENVSGNPHDRYTVPAGSLAASQLFRAVAN